MFLKECGEAGPQLLIMDGQWSQESLAILELVIRIGIYFMNLPSHTTHTLQLRDRSLNTAYQNACSDFLNKNIVYIVKSSHWLLQRKTCRSVLSHAGKDHFNPSAVDPQRLKPSKQNKFSLVSILIPTLEAYLFSLQVESKSFVTQLPYHSSYSIHYVIIETELLRLIISDSLKLTL